MGNHAPRKGNLPPTGYIRIQDAAQVVRSRMFSQEIPEAVLIAAKKMWRMQAFVVATSSGSK